MAYLSNFLLIYGILITLPQKIYKIYAKSLGISQKMPNFAFVFLGLRIYLHI